MTFRLSLSRSAGMGIGALLTFMPAYAFAGPSQVPGRPAVVRQALDQSCGLASLATLLQWGGIAVNEADLLILLRTRSPELADQLQRGDRGLSVSELRALAAALDRGVTLEARYLTAAQLRTVAAREAVIVFSVEGSDKAETNRGHFTILDGVSPTRGYLRADTLDGSYSFQSEAELLRSAMIWRENTVIQVLYARRDSAPLVRAAPVTETEERTYASFARSLLARAVSPLSEGQSLASVTLERTVFKEDFAEIGVPVTITSEIETALFGYRTSLGRGMDLSLGLPVSLETTRFRFEGDGTDETRHWSVGSLAVGVSRSWQVRSDLILGATLDAAFGDEELLRGYGGRFDLAWIADDRITVVAGLDARRAVDLQTRHWATGSGLSAGVVRRLGDRWWASVDGRIPLERGESGSDDGSLLLALEREAGRWVVGGYATAAFSDQPTTVTVGLGARYLFSRSPFRR